MSKPSFTALTLATPRLLLRPLDDGDAPALFGIHADPRVMRYWSSPPWTQIDQARQTIADDRRDAADGASVRLGIVLREGGALVGTCSLFAFHAASRRAEIGYALAADAWGKGYAREAVAAVIDHAFDGLGLLRLEADIDPRNRPSARLLERLGFRHEGLLRERWIVGGEVSDSALYGLLRRDWPGAGRDSGPRAATAAR